MIQSLSPIDNCDAPLVAMLPPTSFESSSQLSESHAPRFAKLSRREGGWALVLLWGLLVVHLWSAVVK
ncbi:hypothetical protein GN956_G13441 [Arapaima gigas]